MGIQGLLPLLKECQRGAHIQEYKGQTLGIDAYVWLHRGAYGCAQEIATGQTTVKYIKYALHKIRLLRHYGVIPYVVFDGGFLPSKKGTETDRESRRNEALTKARDLTLEGKHSQAREYYVKAVDVTPQMAYQLIKALIAEGVSYVVAPYEADAQLAYLEKKGIIDGIITEDSDLLVFGCRKILFKLDPDGRCMEIKRDNFTLCREFSFSGWTDKEFRQMAILSGCDYLESIPGLGLKTAHRLMRRYKSAEKVIRFIRLEGQLKVSRDYEDQFKRAELTFLHQRVFCPNSKKLVHLEDLPDSVRANLSSPHAEELRFIGPFLDDETAHGIACGDLCPLSKAKMVDIAPDAEVLAGNPKPVGHEVKGSIKDFFKPAPSSDRDAVKLKKRNALGEISTNNLFSGKKSAEIEKEPIKPASKPVKSRFFAPAGKSAQSKHHILTIEDSGDEKSDQKKTQVASIGLRISSRSDEANSSHSVAKTASESPKLGIAPIRNPSAPPLDTEIAERSASEVNSALVRTLLDLEMDFLRPFATLPSINMGQQPKTNSEIILPPMPAPAPSSLSQIEDFEDESEHEMPLASSPPGEDDCGRPRKLRRHHSPGAESNYVQAPVPDIVKQDENDKLPASPASNSTQFIMTSPVEQEMLDAIAPESDFANLTDYSSPSSSKSCGRRPEEQSSARRPSKIERQSADSLWSDEAITPDDSSYFGKGFTFAGKQARKRKNGNIGLCRSNAVISTPKRLERSEQDSLEADKGADFDKRVTSVIAGWRDKFAPSSSKKSCKKLRGSTLVPQPKSIDPIVVLSPVRTTKQEAQTLIQICSSPILSSPPQKSVKPFAELSLAAPKTSGRPDTKTLKQTTTLSQSTARALEAFRFKPSLASSSSFGSSQ